MTEPLDHNSSAVQTHLTIVQGVIVRMAENSRSCKMWCITLVAGILFLVARTEESQHALMALAPTLLFYMLDAYYLALERSFIDSHSGFVAKLHSQKLTPSDLYRIAPTGMGAVRTGRSLCSFSIWPFYLMVITTILFAGLLLGRGSE